MLLNGVHLLPDASGALVWPGRQLLAVASPLTGTEGRDAPIIAALAVRKLAALARQRRPRGIVWMGAPLAGLPAREQRDLERLQAEQEWIACPDEVQLAPLTFRLQAGPANKPGEIIARPNPLARCDGQAWPAFVIDGRRLALPAFGPTGSGTEVMSPAFLSLFRRPFQALMLVNGRIVTRPRARLESPA